MFAAWMKLSVHVSRLWETPSPSGSGSSFSFHSVSPASQLSPGKNAIIRAWKSSEQRMGDFHACLHSLRDHPHGGGWSRRMLGTPRKGRRGRAIEARLNGGERDSSLVYLCMSTP